MHFVFIHFHFYEDYKKYSIYKTLKSNHIDFSIAQRKDHSFTENNIHFINDDYGPELKWWQNPESVNLYIQKLKPDMVYIFGLNLPLQFRWLEHFIDPGTILIGQHCDETPWIQKNLWLQQSALRVVDAFVFENTQSADPWLKCAAILESQPIFEIKDFSKNIITIYNSLQDKKRKI
jgi:hypothetical protein